MTKRFVSWEAVSSRPQMDGGSPDDQRERNQAHIEKWSGVLVADLEVPGQSRSYIEYEEAKREIEAYRQLDELIKAKAFDVLVCYNVGRLGRKRSLITVVIDLCYEAGIIVYRTSNPPLSLEFTRKGYSDLLLEAIESATFQNEIDQLREHHKSGMKRRAERGLFPGNIPFGWKAEYYERNKYRLHVDEQAAAAVRRAFELFLMGEGKEAIALQLNREGFKTYGRTRKNQADRTPKPFTNGAIRSMFERVWVYAGYAEVNRTSRKGREFHREKSPLIPPIIDEEFLQRLLAEIALRRKANPPKGNHLFSGVVVCLGCNKRMMVLMKGSYQIKKGKVYSYPILKCYNGCGKQIAFARIERALLAWFDNIQNQQVPTEQPENFEATNREAQQLQKQLDALPQAAERAYTAFVDGIVDKQAYQAQVKRLEAQKRELQDNLQALTLKRAQHRRREDLQNRYETVAEVGREMLEIGRSKPDVVNQWLREYVRVDLAEDRTLTVHLI